MKSTKSLPIVAAIVAWTNSFKRFAHIAIGITPCSHFRTIAFALLLLAASTGMVQAQNLKLGFEIGESGGVSGAPFGGMAAPVLETGTGTNTSRVLKIVTNTGGDVWQGSNFTLTNAVTLTTNKTMTIDVLASGPMFFLVKVNGGVSGAPEAAAVVSYTGTNTWQTCSFTFNSVRDGKAAAANGTYNNFVIHPYWESATQTTFGTLKPARTLWVDNISEFVPEPTAPILTTEGATLIGTTQGTLNGNISSNGLSNITSYGFYWSTTNGFADGAGTQVEKGTTNFTGNISHVLTGLTEGTPYYYKAYATNGIGTTYGVQQSFTPAAIAQITRTVGATGSDYATLKLAFDAINAGSITGAIQLQIIDNTAELTNTATLNKSGTGSANYTSVKIYPTVTGKTITGGVSGALITLNGSNNVTFDGRLHDLSGVVTGSTADLTINNTVDNTTPMTIRLTANASNNTITYCNVKGSGNSWTLGTIVLNAPTTASATGCANNVISYNTFTPSTGTRPWQLIYSVGISGAVNTGNQILNNNFSNCTFASQTGYAINIAGFTTSHLISGNSFYESTTLTASSAGTTYCFILISGGNNHTISNNYMGGTLPQCGGGTFTKTASNTNTLKCILFTSTDTGTASTVENNTIKNINWSNGTGAAQLLCISLESAHNVKIKGNTISDITLTNNATGAAIMGIWKAAANGSIDQEVSNNFISNLNSSAATTGSIYGIACGGGLSTISNNIIVLNSNNAVKIYGIYESCAAGKNNKVYFNTVRIGGTLNAASESYALYSGASTNTRDFRNNIFVNARSNSNAGGKNYAAFFNYGVNTNLTLANNDYFVSGTNGVLGRYNSVDVTTGTVMVTGKDAGSMTVNPSFANPTGTAAIDFKPTATTLVGVVGTGITTDYAGVITRSSSPTMGAWEVPTVPGAPTSVVATAGNEKASVAFTAPASNGGTAITGYTVTSSPAGGTATGASSPLVVSGFTNETPYTFTVTATNAQGTSAASSASNSVTPHATNHIIEVAATSNISALTLTPVSDVVVNNDVVLTINQTTSINSLTVAAGGMVTNTSTLNTPTLTINSNGTDGTGTYINTGTSNVTTLTANQYLGTTRNWYVSSPVASTASSATNISRYYEYVEAGDNADLAVTGSTVYWKGYNPTHTMVAGKGYIALPSVIDAIVTFTGTMNTGDVSIPLSKSLAGYNLIGNPYPCHLTWTKAFVDSKAAQINPTIWYRTNTGSVNSGGDAAWSFKTINASTGEVSPVGTTNIIPPMQAFWVKAVAAGTLVLNSDLLKSHQASNPLKAPAVKNTNRQGIRLEVSNGKTTDETLIYFDAAALDTYDSYDSPRYPESSTVTQLFSTIGSEKLVINGMSEMLMDTPYNIGFVPGNAIAFSIRANEIRNIPTGVKVMLKDNVTLAETDLSDGVSTYYFSSAVSTTDRFSLLFRAPGSSTGLNNTEKLNAQVFVNEANQISIIASEKSTYSIYNALGQKVNEGITNSNRTTPNLNLKMGVYVVNVLNNGKELTTRVIIK